MREEKHVPRTVSICPTRTPGFMIGMELVVGALDVNGRKDLVATSHNGK
jgi:hypothetical protein